MTSHKELSKLLYVARQLNLGYYILFTSVNYFNVLVFKQKQTVSHVTKWVFRIFSGWYN
jgi:hypothetical protein